MEPISVVAASVALAAGIARAAATVAEISVDLRDASDDLRTVSNELVVFQCFVSPLTTGLSRFGAQSNPLLAPLMDQINNAVTGALAVVEKIESTLVKYRGRLTLWLKLRWSLFGTEQIRKLRESLESYKVALGIGLHLMSISIVGEVKNDTEVIREVAEVVKILQKDEILARLVTQASPTESQAKVELWLEKMADYTTCAETAYQATIIDPDEEPARPATTTNPIPELSNLSLNLTDSMLGEGNDPVSTAYDAGPSASVQSEDESTRFSSQKHRPSISHFSTVTSSDYGSAQSNDATLLSRTTLPSSFGRDVTSQASKSESCLNAAPAQENVTRASLQPLTQSEICLSKSTLGTAATKIDWSPLIPQILTQSDFEDIENATQLDMDAIQLSERRRHVLSDSHRERLDSMLLRRLSQDPGSLKAQRRKFCETLLQKGASIEASNGTSINPINHLISQEDWQTLSLLLRYGADPNSRTNFDPRPPLAIAASCDVKCMCALVLAGAEIRSEQRNEDICRRFCEQEVQEEVKNRICCTPLLAAFAAVRQGGRINIKQFWITHFLLKNGADVNFKSCTTAIDFMVQSWPIAAQYRMTKHLLDYGVDLESASLVTQLRQAATVGEARLVQLLVDNGINLKDASPGSSPETDPVVLAAAFQNWSCVDILVTAAGNSSHLHNLVHVFMFKTTFDLSMEALRRTINKFLASRSGIEPLVRLDYQYPRQLSDTGMYGLAKERMTVFDLAERIFNGNNRDRSEVLRLLRGDTDNADTTRGNL